MQRIRRVNTTRKLNIVITKHNLSRPIQHARIFTYYIRRLVSYLNSVYDRLHIACANYAAHVF